MKSARLSGRRMDLLLVSSGVKLPVLNVVKLPGNGQLQAGDMRSGDFRVTSYGHTEFVGQSCLPYSWRRGSAVLPAASAARLGRRIGGQELGCVGITGFAGNLRNRQIQTPIS